MRGPAAIETPEDVQAWLAAIRNEITDDEAAHSDEDEMRRLVLEAIAAGHPRAAELARLALDSENLDFGRWCA